MAILTASIDPLKEDELAKEPLGTFDPLAPENEEIQTMDREWGFAMTPAQRRKAEELKAAVDESVAQQRRQLSQLESRFQTSLAEADKQAGGMLARARGERDRISGPDIQMSTVTLVGSNGQPEGSYRVPTEALKSEDFAGLGQMEHRWDGANLFISTRIPGGIHRGKELHESFLEGDQETREQMGLIDREVAAARKGAGMQIGAMEASIASQRQIAIQQYDQQVAQARQLIERTRQQWTGFLASAKANFERGVETNRGGIRDLLESGALVFKSSVKRKEQ